MKTENKTDLKSKLEEEQQKLLTCEEGTVKHFFGSWDRIFDKVSDIRSPSLRIYPLPNLLFLGTLMYLLRLDARRQVNYKFRENENVAEKYLIFNVQNSIFA